MGPTTAWQRATVRLTLPVVRLQVQTDRIKPGKAPWREYRPEILREVGELRVTPEGAIGIAADGTEIIDVHHGRHPHSRDRRSRSGLSIMTTGDYTALRHTYGPHLVDGIAGESVLLDYEPGLAHRIDLAAADARWLASDLPDPAVGVRGFRVAEPCVEFTRFCLRLPMSNVVGDDVRQGLVDLNGGARGYKMAAAEALTIRVGDRFAVDLP